MYLLRKTTEGKHAGESIRPLLRLFRRTLYYPNNNNINTVCV